MCFITRYDPTDWHRLEGKQKAQYEKECPFAEEVLSSSEAWSLVCDGDILAIVGCTLITPTTYEAFFIGDMEKFKPHQSRTIKRFIPKVFDLLYPCCRIQATVGIMNKTACRFIEFMGFDSEAVLIDYYGPGKDAKLYRILPDAD